VVILQVGVSAYSRTRGGVPAECYKHIALPFNASGGESGTCGAAAYGADRWFNR